MSAREELDTLLSSDLAKDSVFYLKEQCEIYKISGDNPIWHKLWDKLTRNPFHVPKYKKTKSKQPRYVRVFKNHKGENK